MITKFINKILGDQNKKALKKIQPFVEKINNIEKGYQETIKDQEAVLAKTEEFKKRIKNGESVDDLMPEAFALVKTACKHLLGKKWTVREKKVEWDMVPYDVQLIGGIVLHQGNISEMKTGEGKTLVCTMPVYLNALTEKGVFVVTVNEYLARRDAEWMSGLYNYLGLTTGVSVHGMTHEEKKQNYACDITYGTNNEFGFDYLRDNMTTDPEKIVQRNLHYAIVDEVDSILIDEARTPLIISAAAAESTDKYKQYSEMIPQLKINQDYDIDEKSKTTTLTEEGVTKMEKYLGVENIYTDKGFTEVHHIEQALRAQACYKVDVDYMIKDNEIMIIDEFTGRLMPGRRYSGGLHQAIEAKERVDIKRESKTLATVSFQNYFRLFEKLGGMTGTAATEAEEFYQIYGLETLIIPPNRPIARMDMGDAVYKNQKGKYIAAVKKIKELYEKGQPVLVGTISVEKSEVLHKLLKLEGIPHSVLNAKNHEKEAEIITKAGEKGSITIATNMAGRGTDIKNTEEVKELGGLFVLGTERHESRRIDNQLRGRSGRQGDAGASQFFVSMEDELMRLFGGEKIKNMMNTFNIPEDMPIQNVLITRSIESAQKKVEGRNFDIRKHLVEYDDIMNVHREIIYKRRRNFLLNEDQSAEITEMINEFTENLVRNYTEARPPKEWDYKEISEALNAIHNGDLKIEDIKDQEELIKTSQNYLLDNYNIREKELPNPKIMRAIEKAIFLRSTDSLWMDHIDSMSRLRENVAFSGYAQKDPLTEYKSQGFQAFNQLLGMINSSTINTLFKMDLIASVPESVLKRAEPKQTLTNEGQIKSNLQGGPRKTITKSTLDNSNSPVGVRTFTADNQLPTTPQEKVGRNEPCPCGSGKKYKKCCGKET